VAPIIAVAFTWIILLDPFSGSHQRAARGDGLSTRSTTRDVELLRPAAFRAVHGDAFAMWGYFPLCFLFILARMQSIPQDMYEAAEMDGASPLQTVLVSSPSRS
jgi:multiple sugar transport system permease protein